MYFLLVRSFFIMVGSFFYGKSDGLDFSMMGMPMFQKFTYHVQINIIWRSIYGFGSFSCTMISIHLLPVSVSISITMSSIFTTMVLGWVLANEVLSGQEIASIVGGTLGVCMLSYPEYFNKTHQGSSVAER